MVKTLSQTPLQLLDSLKLTECHRQRERPKETTQAVPQGSLPLRAVHREAIWLPLTTATLEDSWGHTFFSRGKQVQQGGSRPFKEHEKQNGALPMQSATHF